MTDKKHDLIDQKLQDLNNDGVDRRGFLRCMAWAGTGLVWTVSGGILGCQQATRGTVPAVEGGFTFAQISDSHIGFSKEPNKHVTATFQRAVELINGMAYIPGSKGPAFVLH